MQFRCRFIVYPIGNGKHMVQSVPGELSLQETSVLSTAASQGQGFVTIEMLIEKLGWARGVLKDPKKQIFTYFFFSLLMKRWTEFRAKQAIDKIIGDGLAWVDSQGDTKSYWFPSLFPKRQQIAATNWTFCDLVKFICISTFYDIKTNYTKKKRDDNYFSFNLTSWRSGSVNWSYHRSSRELQLIVHFESTR